MKKLSIFLSLSGIVVLALLMVYIVPYLPAPQQASEQLTEKQLVDDDFLLGNPDAPVLFAEFGDFMCENCAELAENVEPKLREKFVEKGKLKMVFRDFVSPSHGQGIPAAAAAACTGEKFWEMHDLLYRNSYENDKWAQAENPATFFEKYAASIGVNISRCMDDDAIINEITEDIKKGLSIGVIGTPTIIIGNEKKGFVRVLGAQPYATYERIIEEYEN